jgi:type IV pilus assembly protein PilV
MRTHIKSMHGASLIEVLVAMVILAIGMLGLAGLQLSSMNNNQSAFYRSQATFLANDMLDRVRVNKAAIADYAVDVADDAATGSDAVAVADVDEWLGYVTDSLPDGEASVVVNGNQVTIRVEWDDKRGDQSGDSCYVSGTRKACFVTDARI